MKLNLSDTIIRFTDETQEFDTRIINMNSIDDAMNGILDISTIEANIQTSTTEIETLEADIDAKQAEIDAKQAEIDNENAEIETLESEIRGLQSQITNLENRRSEIQTARLQKFQEYIQSLDVANQQQGNAPFTQEFKETLLSRMLSGQTINESIDPLVQQTNDSYNNIITEINTQEAPLIAEKETKEGLLNTAKNTDLPELQSELTTLKTELGTLQTSLESKTDKKAELEEDLVTAKEAKEEMKKAFLKSYDATNALVLITTEDEDEASEALKKVNEMKEMEPEVIEAEMAEQADKIKNKDAEELANELVNALESGDSEEPIVKDILDQLKKDKNRIGLRRNIYNRIKNNSVKSLDADCTQYATIVIEECSKYFSTGVMGAFVHIGTCVGASVSILSTAVSKMVDGINDIKESTKSVVFLEQADGLAKGISTLISNGTINTIGAGVIPGLFPKPKVIRGKTNYNAGYKIGYVADVSIIIKVAALAGYIILAAGGLASMLAKTKKPWDSMINLIGAKDGNDLFAALLAAGIKVYILSSATKVQDTNSDGMGLLIPFGP